MPTKRHYGFCEGGAIILAEADSVLHHVPDVVSVMLGSPELPM